MAPTVQEFNVPMSCSSTISQLPIYNQNDLDLRMDLRTLRMQHAYNERLSMHNVMYLPMH